MTYVIVAPPPLKPSEPGVSAGAAAAQLRLLGVDAIAIDASIGWHRWALRAETLAHHLEAAHTARRPAGELGAFRRAVAGLSASSPPLKRPATYRNRHVYTSAIRELELGLQLAALPTPSYRLALSMVSLVPPTRRVESSDVLDELAEEASPFDRYFIDELIPHLRAIGADRVGLSVAFQQQTPAAFRLAHLLAERLSDATRVLGGPLVACWREAGIDLERPPFTRFDHIWDGTDVGLARSAGVEVATLDAATGPLAGALDESPWESYLVPSPTVPAALGRGCSWRRCTFCPDYLHPRHRPCGVEALEDWLREVARRFPKGAMIHLTDSALPPSYLQRIAETIRREGLPLRWHGFVRVEEDFADSAVAELLVEGGCALLQIGVESGSARMLERMGKGANPDRIRRVLSTLGRAGLQTQVYLLFGLPGETDADREETLELVVEQEGAIGAINAALLNLPLGSPMHRRPDRFGITELRPFHESTDLSLSIDFRCGDSHPRLEARRWLEKRFFKHPATRRISGHLRTPFKANHLCFLDLLESTRAQTAL